MPEITIVLFLLCIFFKGNIHCLPHFPAPKPDLLAVEKKTFPLKAEDKGKAAPPPLPFDHLLEKRDHHNRSFALSSGTV